MYVSTIPTIHAGDLVGRFICAIQVGWNRDAATKVLIVNYMKQ